MRETPSILALSRKFLCNIAIPQKEMRICSAAAGTAHGIVTVGDFSFRSTVLFSIPCARISPSQQRQIR
jgi:hypothetical protein